MNLRHISHHGAGIAFAVALLAADPRAAFADMIDTDGMEPWEVCGLCHGHTGLSATSRFPRLAGQKETYLLKQMNDFSGEHRLNDGGQMRSIITEASVEDYPAIAKWFASQLPPEPDVADGDVVAGALLWAKAGCGECHGAEAPDDPTRPHLFAQHEDYIAKQLRDFREGERTNDPNGLMRARAAGLSDEDISALAAFAASQVRK